MSRVHPCNEELVFENRLLKAQVETLTKRVEALTHTKRAFAHQITTLAAQSEAEKLMFAMLKEGVIKSWTQPSAPSAKAGRMKGAGGIR